MRNLLFCFAILSLRTVALTGDTPDEGPAWIGTANDGRLLYARDEMGNQLPDFSRCGYRGGQMEIPEAPVKETVRPGNPDDRAAIQQAIDRVSALPLDVNGIRGAVLLSAGIFRLSDGVRITRSGVVLRGEGSAETGTILRATARQKHTLVSIAGVESQPKMVGPLHEIADGYVPVGSFSLTLREASDLAVGDAIMVWRPSTSDWIKTIGMDHLANPWNPGDRDLVWERIVSGMDGRTVFLNAPITTALESRFGGGTVSKYQWPERIENCGVENVRAVSDTDGTPTDENHGWVFIGIQRATDCWVRRVTAQHFGYACVAITDQARSISVLDSECIDPVSEIAGGRRYGFYLDDSQLCLVQGCRNRNDRHQFVTGSNTCGPNAFVDGIGESAKSDAGPHHRWANGILWDSIVLKGGDLNARNRGNSGSGHGWAGANCVFWNCRAEGLVVQNPPTARNWCIGSIGAIREGKGFVGPHDPGTFYSHGTPVLPPSLFAAQRRDASRGSRLQIRDYVTGRFDGFARDDLLPVDEAWKTKATSNGFLPWFHKFHVSPAEKIVGGSLSIAVRTSSIASGRLYVGSLERSFSFTDAKLRSEWPGATVMCFDLADDLALLRGEMLNLAVADSVSVDWAILNLTVDRGEEP